MTSPRLAVAATALAVVACAAIGPQEAPPPFDLFGRVAVSYDGHAFSSSLRWRHGFRDDEIFLLTPLGQTVARILSGPDGATLTTADQRQYQATSVASLTRQGLGWALPLESLRYWVRGEPAPGSAPGESVRDATGRLLRLEQTGWRVTFLYPPAVDHDTPPRMLDLASGAQRIRLVIDDWRATDAP